jgi:hypothetical protein
MSSSASRVQPLAKHVVNNNMGAKHFNLLLLAAAIGIGCQP